MNKRSYCYKAYGLIIRSEIEIPELMEGEGRNDVTIAYGDLSDHQPRREVDGNYLIRPRDEYIYVFMPQVGSFKVQGGDSIVIDPIADAETRYGFRFLVSGMAMGLLLHQRGIMTLHASAVSIGDEAVAFLGWRGAGKSTTAAAFHSLGFPVLTDDLLALNVNPREEITVQPGYPALKLLPEVAHTFSDKANSLSKINSVSLKRNCPVDEGFIDTPIPLRAIYVLDYIEDGKRSVNIESMSSVTACMEVIKHSYAVRMLQRAGCSQTHLNQCATLSERLPIRVLQRKKSLNNLFDIVKKVLSNMTANSV